MHCQWGRKPPNCPFSLGFRHLAGGGPSHGLKQHAYTFGKDSACRSGDILANRQTDRHTDVLITIFRKKSNPEGHSGSLVLLIYDCGRVRESVARINEVTPTWFRCLRWVSVRRYVTSHSGQLSLLPSADRKRWEGNRRSGVALAMRHRLVDISTYGLSRLWKSNENLVCTLTMCYSIPFFNVWGNDMPMLLSCPCVFGVKACLKWWRAWSEQG